MMQEILKPLLDSEVLTEQVKESISNALNEALKEKEKQLREDFDRETTEKLSVVKEKLTEKCIQLEKSYKAKVDDIQQELEAAKILNEDLAAKVEELEANPFINVTESDMSHAESKLVDEITEKLEIQTQKEHEKFNEAFEIIHSANMFAMNELVESLESVQVELEAVSARYEQTKRALAESKRSSESTDDAVAYAVGKAEKRMRAEYTEKLETIKENLVTSTEIFLDQELSEVKRDSKLLLKESQGRELLESMKDIVKQYWDVEKEVSDELIEFKRLSESKADQYKAMLKKEHTRLEESKGEIEQLKKKLIVESKGSVLSSDKKQALAKLASGIDSDKLEQNIDALMESVIESFDANIASRQKNTGGNSKSGILHESQQQKQHKMFGNGDVAKERTQNTELEQLLEMAGVTR